MRWPTPAPHRVFLAIAGCVLLVAVAAPAQADGFLIPTRPREPVRGRWAITYHRVESVVRGPHAQVTVDQEFVNLSATTLEAEYVFPLPKGAIVSSLTLYENGKGLEGRILRAEEARRIYEEIVRRKKDPALIELVGHGVLRARVFPIEPGDSRRVILRYTQVLGRDGDTLRLRYPRIVGILPGTETREVFSPPRRPEAAQPFRPEIKPLEAYAAAILDDVTIDQALAESILE